MIADLFDIGFALAFFVGVPVGLWWFFLGGRSWWAKRRQHNR